MSALLAIAALALLFVVFCLLPPRESGSCRGCPGEEDPGSCGECPLRGRTASEETMEVES